MIENLTFLAMCLMLFFAVFGWLFVAQLALKSLFGIDFIDWAWKFTEPTKRGNEWNSR
jgi:hypothetical protein